MEDFIEKRMTILAHTAYYYGCTFRLDKAVETDNPVLIVEKDGEEIIFEVPKRIWMTPEKYDYDLNDFVRLMCEKLMGESND